jgi:hypothetical protein
MSNQWSHTTAVLLIWYYLNQVHISTALLYSISYERVIFKNVWAQKSPNLILADVYLLEAMKGAVQKKKTHTHAQ